MTYFLDVDLICIISTEFAPSLLEVEQKKNSLKIQVLGLGYEIQREYKIDPMLSFCTFRSLLHWYLKSIFSSKD